MQSGLLGNRHGYNTFRKLSLLVERSIPFTLLFPQLIALAFVYGKQRPSISTVTSARENMTTFAHSMYSRPQEARHGRRSAGRRACVQTRANNYIQDVSYLSFDLILQLDQIPTSPNLLHTTTRKAVSKMPSCSVGPLPCPRVTNYIDHTRRERSLFAVQQL